LESNEVNWKAVSGISAGALNAGGISLFPPGEEVAMSEWLVDTWLGLLTHDIWQMWPEGLIDGLLN